MPEHGDGAVHLHSDLPRTQDLAHATDIVSKLRVLDPLGKVVQARPLNQCGAWTASKLAQHKLLELFPQQNHWHHVVDDEDTD